MKPIPFRLGLYLTELSHQDDSDKGEAAFHRWFPEGESDSLILNTGYPKAILRVWFERSEVSDGTLATKEEKERLAQADSEVFARYGVLWSGPIRGELRVEGGLSPERIAALEKTSDDVISEHYDILRSDGCLVDD